MVEFKILPTSAIGLGLLSCKRWSRSCRARDVNIRGMDWEQDSDQEDPNDGQGVLSAAVVRTQSSPHPPVRASCLLSLFSVVRRVVRISLSLSKMSGWQKIIEKK